MEGDDRFKPRSIDRFQVLLVLFVGSDYHHFSFSPSWQVGWHHGIVRTIKTLPFFVQMRSSITRIQYSTRPRERFSRLTER